MQTHAEREEKFEVDDDWVMPDVGDLVPAGGSVQETVHKLENGYFDTPGGSLRDLGVTLRRRVGGGESGWQLKVPTGQARTEFRSGSTRRTVPNAIAVAIAGLRDGDDLMPVATIWTVRTARRIADADGELVFELADDRVRSTVLGEEPEHRAWREIEVELGPASRKGTAREVASWLRAAGAKRSRSSNKLNRALGVDEPPLARSGEHHPYARPGTVGALAVAYLAEQCELIALNDISLRTGAAVARQTLAAVRRLRNTLVVFPDLFDPDQRSAVDVELRWYAGLLGAVRDGEVLAARLATRIDALPAAEVLGPVAADLQVTLAAERKTACDALAEAMSSDRYGQLLRTLRRWRTAPPLTAVAAAKAKHAKRPVQKARRKATKRLELAGGDVESMRRALKSVRRLRHAAELTSPAVPKAARLVQRAKRHQAELGEFRDAVAAASFLRRAGARVGSAAGHNGFTYGLLLAGEWASLERSSINGRRLDLFTSWSSEAHVKTV